MRGRDLNEADTSASDGSTAVVVNEAFVRRYIASAGQSRHAGGPQKQDPPYIPEFILERNAETGRAPRRLQIVGVARDVKTRSLGDEGLAVVYMPARSSLSLVVRATGLAAGLVRTLEQTAVQQLPEAVVTATPMTARVSVALRPSQLGAVLLSGLAGLGLLLAMVGLHGVVSYAASRRPFEIGVRMALGATRSMVVTMMLRDSARLVGSGCVAGAVLSVMVVQVLRPLLAAGQNPIDPLALIGVPAALITVGTAASFLPARRAAGVDPVVALRHE